MTAVHIEKQDDGSVSVLFGRAFFVVPDYAQETFLSALSDVFSDKASEASFNVPELRK